MNFAEELTVYFRAKCPIVYVTSIEERRVEAACASVAAALKMDMQIWSIRQGFLTFASDKGGWTETNTARRDPDAALTAIEGLKQRTLFVLRDFHMYMDAERPANTMTIRGLRDLASALRSAPSKEAKAVVIIAPRLVLPDELRADVQVVEWALPTVTDLLNAINASIDARTDGVAQAITPAQREAAAQAAIGLTMEESMNAVGRSLVMTKMMGAVVALDPGLIAKEKKQAVARGGLAEWIDPDVTLDDIGGLENIKAWLRQRQSAFTQAARDYGLPPPKGIMLVGMPGGGKSLIAKATGAALSRPIIRVDFGQLYSKFIGDSESNLKKIIKTLEACAPCIAFCDEIEKGLAGAGGGSASDGGVATRILGTFLTWLQEKKSDVFVVSSANDVSALPPELLRKGRFDEIFAIDLPNRTERTAIWQVQGRKYRKPTVIAAAPALAAISEGYTGAEIEAALVDAMFPAFAAKREPNISDITTSLRNTVPLAKTAPEKIEAIRTWCKGRARSASIADVSAQAAPGVRAVELE